MNTPARYALTAAALGALLLLTGCFTTRSARNEPGNGVYHFAVVDKSKDLEVTPQLLAELRDSVTNYLKEEGYTRDGEYVVRVNLTPGEPEEQGRWVVLRISNVPARTYTLLAAYPGADDYYPYDFHGYYNYGYPYFARYGFYDPFDSFYYGGGSYYYPPNYVPSPKYKPGDRNNHPTGTRRTWQGNNPNPDGRSDSYRPRSDRPRPDNPRSDSPRSDGRDHWRNDHPGPSSTGSGGGSYSPPPSTNYSPSPSSNYSPPSSQSSSPPQPREDRHSVPTEEK